MGRGLSSIGPWTAKDAISPGREQVRINRGVDNRPVLPGCPLGGAASVEGPLALHLGHTTPLLLKAPLAQSSKAISP